MTALPPRTEAKLGHYRNGLSAYDVCLRLEKNATTDEGRMHARILGYLILHAPSHMAQSEVVKVIHSCAEDQKKLFDLGQCFRLWFIRPFKKSKGPTPRSSDHPSRPSFDRVKEDLKAQIKEAPKDRKGAKTQALIRDGYRCPVTGLYDMIASKQSLVDGRSIKEAGGAVHTELAHILPESTYFDISKASTDKKDYSASVLAVLQRFGYDVDQVNGAKVHSLYNVITMEKNAHDAFDRLEMWFESTTEANCYDVKTASSVALQLIRPQVTFTSPNPSILPYPSPQLLALHATCAKVAHFSGAAEYIDNFDSDADHLDVLATDGSSSAVLDHVLWGSISRPVGTVA
ncbi:hypothetical protein F5I97DRAFT_1867971 [Phlebopus sp. FC_14]|nr:hypothetical protein F5I97DRAFT_1867971 [Phlebopus sp. FC_14]